MHTFLAFWFGGVACFLLIMFSEMKMVPEVLESDDWMKLRYGLELKPEIWILIVLYVLFWPAAIAWNTARILELRKAERSPPKPAELPAEMFKEPPGLFDPPEFGRLDDRTTCQLCRHRLDAHGEDGCTFAYCYCHTFSRFGEGTGVCACREWGAPHPGLHHPKCPSQFVATATPGAG